MGSFERSFAGKKREAYRRTIRAYCQKIPYRGKTLVLPCWKCDLIKGGKDCKGNPIGTRELIVAQAMTSILELVVQNRPLDEHRAVSYTHLTLPTSDLV